MTATISIHNCQVLAFQPDKLVMPSLDEFLECAKVLSLSTTVCCEEIVDTRILQGLEHRLINSGAERHRKVLILCGAFLEEQISLSAQYMLAIGFDVYLLRELILSRDPVHSHVHDSRLLQSGAVATTLKQLTYEWMATEPDEEIRNTLKNLSSGQEKTWRPA